MERKHNGFQKKLKYKGTHIIKEMFISFKTDRKQKNIISQKYRDMYYILQIRSKNIMASLEETKVAFTKDEETNGLKCNVCNVCLNSIQQLQTHLNGIL